jgi:murein endopeptidase
MPQDLHEWLVILAKRERRSLNAQLVVLLERLHEQAERDAHDQ